MTIRSARIVAAAAALVALLLGGSSRAQSPSVAQTADGKPDLSGIWRSASNRYLTDLFAGGAQPSLTPWARTVYDERRASKGAGRPSDRCLPRGVPGMMLARDEPWKLVQTPGAVFILFSRGLHYRQIFTDGRAFPDDAPPTWIGYSIGRWEGDTLVAETIGLTDETWLDEGGHPHSDALRVTERFRRRSAGAMDVDITIADPKAYTAPWHTTVRFERVPGADLVEQPCAVGAANTARQ